MEEKTMKKIVSLVLCLALVLALGTVAFAEVTGNYLKDVYAKATSEGAEATKTNIDYTPAAEHKDDKGNVIDGNVAYYTLSAAAFAGKNYALVDSLAKADVVISNDLDGKNKLLYLDEITSAVSYKGASVLTNVGTKCGQYNLDAKKTYYVGAQDVVYVADKEGTVTLKVDGKLVTATQLETVLANVKVPHVVIPVVDPEKGIVGYQCNNCKLAAVEAPNYASIPANADRTGLPGNWYFPAAAAATTTTGVTSAKTFDAGVAMYAGLALMSVAGSAVVIGKKKEF